MIDKAIEKITKEMMEIDTPLAIGIEEHLTKVCKTEHIAEKILNPEKSLKGACDVITEEARKRAKKGSAMISDMDAYRMADEYFGIYKPEKSKRINIMDLI